MEKKFFDQPIKNDKITYENIRKIATGQGDDYKIDYSLDYLTLEIIIKLLQ